MTSLLFSNPWGWLGLLGLPLVVLIHFLQQPTKRVITSTLFLFEHTPPQSFRGSVIEQLRNSWPLWLQLLAVLLLTWLLLEPRWVQKRSESDVIIVLDSSASMWPYKQKLLKQVSGIADFFQSVSASTNWLLMESASQRGLLYRGQNQSELLNLLQEWEPIWGMHDSSKALEIALQRKGDNGVVIFFTDHRATLPAGVVGVGVGSPINQVGFVGSNIRKNINSTEWTALVKNWGTMPAERIWWIESDLETKDENLLQLEPNQAVVLKGLVPKDITEWTIHLAEDDFPLDNTMPILRPLDKTLNLYIDVKGKMKRVLDKLITSNSYLQLVANENEADVILATSLTGFVLGMDGKEPRANIIFRTPRNKAGSREPAPIIQETHPFTRGVSWQGLLSSGPMSFQMGEEDQVLLWQKDKPLIFLGSKKGKPQLMFNFDFEHSNADRLPAFLILLHRYFLEVAEGKVAYHRRILKTNEILSLEEIPDGSSIVAKTEFAENVSHKVLTTRQARQMAASGKPSRLSIELEGQEILRAAVQFEEPLEADLRKAESYSDLENEMRALQKSSSKPDPWEAWWIVIILAGLVLSWYFQSSYSLSKANKNL
ncbi:MAG: VWA domain-containing protein [Verrucomicrobiota bacterium]